MKRSEEMIRNLSMPAKLRYAELTGQSPETLAAGLALMEGLTSEYFPLDLPVGQKGQWRVVRSQVDELRATVDSMRYAMGGLPEMATAPGEYTALIGPMGVMMSNTQMEYRTNIEVVAAAHGHVLVTGLGLGMILRPLFANEKVSSVVVVEKEQDVIDLVLPSYADLTETGQLRVVHADAFTWEPDLPFDFAYHDIWPMVGSDNLAEMEALRNHYADHAMEQHCWAEVLCRRMQQVEQELLVVVHQIKIERGELPADTPFTFTGE